MTDLNTKLEYKKRDYKNIEYEMVPISTLKPYAQNTKCHTKLQVSKIAASIKNYGFDVPIVIDENSMILKGHGRWEALRLLGREYVPVIRRIDLSEEEKRIHIISDNKLAESEWDPRLLIDEILELEGVFGIKDLGFDARGLDKLLPEDMFNELSIPKKAEKDKRQENREDMFDGDGERNPFYGESSMISELENKELYKLSSEDFIDHHDDIIINFSSGKDSVHEDSRMWFKLNGKLIYSTPAKLIDELITIKSIEINKHGQTIIAPEEKLETPTPTSRSLNTANIEFQPVKYIMYHEIEDDLYEVEISGLRSVTVTKDHSLMKTVGHHGLETVLQETTVKNLSMNDSLSFPNEIPADSNDVDLPNWIFRLAGLWIADGCYALNRKIVMSTGGDEKVIDFLSKIPRLLSKEDQIREILSTTFWDKGNKMKVFDEIAERFLVSRSCVSNAYYREQNLNTPGRKPKTEFIRAKLLENGDVWLSNKHLVDTMQELGFIGLYKEKRVPNWLFSASKRQIALFLAGYVDGDGCIGERGISIASVNEDLLKDVRDLFLRFGVSGGMTYAVKIGGFRTKYSGLFSYNIGNIMSVRRFISNIPTFKSKEILKSIIDRQGKNLRNKGLASAKVKSIRILPTYDTVRVFDFEVENTHMFIANGIVVHNSLASSIWCFERFDPRKINLLFVNPGYRVEWPQTIEYIDYANDFFRTKYKWDKRIIVGGSNDVKPFEEELIQKGFMIPHMCFVQGTLKLAQMKTAEIAQGWRKEDGKKRLKIISIRWEESKNREREYPERGFLNGTPFNYCSPIIDWTGDNTAKYVFDHGIKLNPVYQFSPRAGCMCCPSCKPTLLNVIKEKYPVSYRNLMEWHSISARKTGSFSKFVDKFLVVPDEIKEEAVKEDSVYQKYAMSDEELVLELERVRGVTLPRPYFV